MPKRMFKPLLFLCSLIGSSCLSVAAKDIPTVTLRPSSAPVATWLENHRDRPTAIRAFVQRMPKGGDIHSHLSGAVYAEHYLEWAIADGYCIDPTTIKLIFPQDCAKSPNAFPAAELFKRTNIYDALVNQWSTRNLPFAGKSGHDQFFQAFEGFDPISSDLARLDEMVAEVANRAAAQHTSYLELLLTFQGSKVRQLAKGMTETRNFAAMHQAFLDKGLMTLVQTGQQELDTLERATTASLSCGTAKAQPGCQVTVRFLQQTSRIKAPAEVFAQLVYAFELAKVDRRVVGINLVAPEDHPVALRDYGLQMEMLQFLHRQSPGVKISLHAGELTLGLVPPEALRFHIRQAVEVAGASRIGHGVDILQEDNPIALMAEMRKRGVMVEICLTSNEVILLVHGKAHPLPDYLAAGVPVTLASDDEGIARIDLSHEYELAVQRYNLKYSDLKRLARNSLEYSFLAGSSLWQSPEFDSMVGVCRGEVPGSAVRSKGCEAFLQGSDRARTQWKLEADYAAFEALSEFR
jgi:hypothetical protein